MRKQSKNDLEKDLFKLMNNAIFGKSMENVLNRSNVKLINKDPEKLLKLIKQPNFENAYQISNRLALVESKPIYMGAVILETSKLHMYEFWYNHLKVKYGNKIQLIYTDTDSFVIEVETDDIYKDMYEVGHLYDFSDYPKDHQNHKVVKGQGNDEYKMIRIGKGALKNLKNILKIRYNNGRKLNNKYLHDDIIISNNMKNAILKNTNINKLSKNEYHVYTLLNNYKNDDTNILISSYLSGNTSSNLFNTINKNLYNKLKIMT